MSNPLPVRLVGGPDDWNEHVLDHLTAQELNGPRQALGAYLISSHVPAGHPDPAARAVYEPNNPPWPAHVWFFRGWFPYGGPDAQDRAPEHEADLTVHVDPEGLPAALRPQNGDTVRIVRVLAHWEATGQDQLAPDVWHVLTRDGDWHLSHHLGERWTGGALPALTDDGDLPV